MQLNIKKLINEINGKGSKYGIFPMKTYKWPKGNGKCLILLIIKETKIKTRAIYYFISVTMSIIKTKEEITNVGKQMKRNPCTLLVGM